jgi:hypothetical protein
MARKPGLTVNGSGTRLPVRIMRLADIRNGWKVAAGASRTSAPTRDRSRTARLAARKPPNELPTSVGLVTPSPSRTAASHRAASTRPWMGWHWVDNPMSPMMSSAYSRCSRPRVAACGYHCVPEREAAWMSTSGGPSGEPESMTCVTPNGVSISRAVYGIGQRVSDASNACWYAARRPGSAQCEMPMRSPPPRWRRSTPPGRPAGPWSIRVRRSPTQCRTDRPWGPTRRKARRHEG